MFLTGYDIGADAVRALAEPTDGPTAAAVAAIAARTGTAVLHGHPEWVCNDVFNAVTLVGPNGVRLAGYRKTHLCGELDRTCFTAGAGPPAVCAGTAGAWACWSVTTSSSPRPSSHSHWPGRTRSSFRPRTCSPTTTSRRCRSTWPTPATAGPRVR
ncbi:hypothetical protein DMP17_29260 [Pseudonocardia sp. TMWB2A]|uniref:nitrilase-related carbon-nitrogen hydrolase n=1 Tax=Pseudonocardia sp. TMWB2A TaxID=687430 RepID=UPI0030ABA920